MDWQEGVIAMHDRSATLQLNPHAYLTEILIGGMQPSTHTSIGISYRLGKLRGEEGTTRVAKTEGGRFESGGQIGSLTKGNSLFFSSTGNQLNTSIGGGGWFTYQLRSMIGLDSTVMYFPNNQGFLVSFQSGGNALEGLFGLKAGWKRGKVGYFAKARPGFLRFDGALARFFSYEQPPQHLPYVGITHFVFDVGGVVEVYPTRRTTLRFDMGDTIWRIGPRELIGLYQQNVVAPGDIRHTIQLISGFGVRF